MKTILVIAAIVCFVLAAFGVEVFNGLIIGWLGLAFFAIASLPLENIQLR